jgi:hypothetical protein
MAYDKFLIAPISDGIRRDVEPWLIPEAAFEELNNAYIFRGRIKNRVGSINVGSSTDVSEMTSRLRINVGTTDGAGTLAGTVPGGAASIGAIGQMFSIGDEIFTVTTAGAAAMITTSATATVYTFNTGTGAFDIQTSVAATAVYYYPAKPVMGFANYEAAAINDENTYAFDTFFAYQLLATGWERLDGETVPGDAQWSGTDSQFFWSITWKGATEYDYTLFTTNYNADDNIRYFDGTNWTTFTPQYGPNVNETVESARIVIPFQNRLILLNTIESFDATAATRTFQNRMRYSADSTILNALHANAFREDVVPGGSFRDAPTREAIVSAKIFKNRLIVYFERSTYEIVYLGFLDKPFVWKEINSTLGCESTFSVVSFDNAILGVGQTGIHACTGANVERIDSKIPDAVFEIRNDDGGVHRVCGIRDYYNEMVYWSIPYHDNYQTYPNRILAYNYNMNTWAFFDDIITAFGYHQPTDDLTWAEMTDEWQHYNVEWDDGAISAQQRLVIAGNQQGFTFVMFRDYEANAASQQITNITEAAGVITITSISHNLSSGDWVRIEQPEGTPELDENNYKVRRITDDTFTIDNPPIFTGPYEGGGVIRLVSKVDIYSKRFNFYSKDGNSTSITETMFLIDKHEYGELTIDYLSSTSGLSLRDSGIATNAILGTSILEMGSYGDFEDVQSKFWHTVYLQAQGESVQLRIFWSDEQMADSDIPLIPFQIHGIIVAAAPTQEL